MKLRSLLALSALTVNLSLNAQTLQQPTDITADIPACHIEESSSVISLWNTNFIGEDTNGTFRRDTWSTEGQINGTNMLTPFLGNESSDGVLSDQICHIDTISVKPGVYKITARVCVFNDTKGAESISGATLFGNFQQKDIVDTTKTASTSLSNGEEGYFTYSTTRGIIKSILGYYAPEATTYAIVGDDGKLTFGIKAKDANYYRQIYKDFKVYYLGNGQDAFDVAHATDFSVSKIGDDVLVTRSLKDKANGYIDIYKDKVSTQEQVMKAIADYNTIMSDSIKPNIAAWKELKALISKVATYKFEYYCKDEEEAANKQNMIFQSLLDTPNKMITDKTASTDSINAEINRINDSIRSSILPIITPQDSLFKTLEDAYRDAYIECDDFTSYELRSIARGLYFEGIRVTSGECLFTECYAEEKIKNIKYLIAAFNFREPHDLEFPMYYSDLIVNNSFEMGDLTGWKATEGTSTGVRYNNIDEADGNYIFNTWSVNAPEGGFFLSQDIIDENPYINWPKGLYSLQCLVASDKGNKITLSVNGESKEVTITGDETHAETVSVYFTLANDRDKISISVTSPTWFKADNFNLYYWGTDTNINNISVLDTTHPSAIYSIGGARQSRLNKGLNILRTADGKVMKVIGK